MFETLVWPNSPKEENGLFVGPDFKLLFCFGRAEISVWKGVVYRMPQYGDCLIRNAKNVVELAFHPLRMNEYVIGEPILNSQRKAIEQRIVRISSALINVMCSYDNLLPQGLIIYHHQSSIQVLKFVIP